MAGKCKEWQRAALALGFAPGTFVIMLVHRLHFSEEAGFTFLQQPDVVREYVVTQKRKARFRPVQYLGFERTT